jgi:hypothetical protein
MQEVRGITDNKAALQLRVDKGTNTFLSTLAQPGEAQFLTVLKPCSILLPHVHQNAHEFYSVIFGPHIFSALCSHTCCSRIPVHLSLVTSGSRTSCFSFVTSPVYTHRAPRATLCRIECCVILPLESLLSASFHLQCAKPRLSSTPSTIMREPCTRTPGECG